MPRNVAYLLMGAVIAVGAVFGYLYYEENREKSGIEIEISPSGVTIDEK